MIDQDYFDVRKNIVEKIASDWQPATWIITLVLRKGEEETIDIKYGVIIVLPLYKF